MFFEKMKKVIQESRDRTNYIISQNNELEWAHIFHDLTRGKDWLVNLSISPGRWAGNYSFFYVVTRILLDYKPHRVIELGLGESSKVISSFIENEIHTSLHTIVEHDEDWVKSFNSRFELSRNSKIVILELEEKAVEDFVIKAYKKLSSEIKGTFDLYIVDGPFGTDRFSRYDICTLIDRCRIDDEFMIVIDDYDRRGEKDTVHRLIDMLERKGIKTFTGIYAGIKSQIIIATTKYRFSTSL